jgi:hypothetical protein
MKFTDRFFQKLQPKGNRFEILAGDGFTLRVTPTGVKSFYFIFKTGGKNYRLHLGNLISWNPDPISFATIGQARLNGGIDKVFEWKRSKVSA